MTRWRRILANLAAGLVALAAVVLSMACGPEPGPPPTPVPHVQPAAPEVVPAHVRQALAYIRLHGNAPPGHVGGRVFGNYEGVLPRYDGRRKRIVYREWDVHPRAEGRGRGAERLVTGNDGRAWYTADHYRTFVEVK